MLAVYGEEEGGGEGAAGERDSLIIMCTRSLVHFF